MKKRDFIFIVLAMLICILLLLINTVRKNADTVLVYSDGKLFGEFTMNENRTVDINTKNILVIENGYAYMQSATCPDKLCVKQGKISDNSRDIICLPNRVSVKLTKSSDIDTVSK